MNAFSGTANITIQEVGAFNFKPFYFGVFFTSLYEGIFHERISLAEAFLPCTKTQGNEHQRCHLLLQAGHRSSCKTRDGRARRTTAKTKCS